MAGHESSPGSGHDDDELSKKRQPGVKRACNECRQQKVSHVHVPPRAWRNAENRLGSQDRSFVSNATALIPPVSTAC